MDGNLNYFRREELRMMDARNRELFLTQAQMDYRGYNIRVMGTPLPESSDSEVEFAVPNSQCVSHLPRGQVRAGYNFMSQPSAYTSESQFHGKMGRTSVSSAGFMPFMHTNIGGASSSAPVGNLRAPMENLRGGMGVRGGVFMPMPSMPPPTMPLPSGPAFTSGSAPVRSSNMESPQSASEATTAADRPAAPPANIGGSSSQPCRTSAGRKKSAASSSREGGRMVWQSHQVVILLECKKAEWIEGESQTGRDQIVTAEAKLKKLQSALAAKGVIAETQQVRWKWDILLMKYKSVRLYNKRTGVAPFETLLRAQKKEENLPTDFEPAWFDMIEDWYSSNPTIDPPCLADSSSPFAGLEVPRTLEEEADITEREEDEPSARRTNSGVKRKSGPKTTQVISNCMGKLLGTMLEIEKGREEREICRLKYLDEIESKRLQLDERRIEIEDRRASNDAERSKELVGALTSVATAVSSLCALKGQQNSQK